MGTLAVEQALRGVYANTTRQGIAFYCADTIDTDQTYQLCAIARDFLENGREIVLNIVSKSGTTTETLVNASIFVDLLRSYRPETYHDWVVITSDEGSPLMEYAEQHDVTSLTIPQQLGGRFSVLSAVGMFPLALLGVDIDALQAGAREATQACLEDHEENPAMLSAIILYQHYAHGRNIHDTFLFAPGLRCVGEWYRQLMGESIGKKKGKDDQTIRVGITPTVSVGTLDLHSVAQLYLAGPYDKFTTFVYTKQHSNGVTIPDAGFVHKLPVSGRSVAEVKDAVLKGVKRAYQGEDRPYVSLAMADTSETSLGQLLQFKMFEIVYLGILLQINPFDQPQVELYKQETRDILKANDKEQT